MQAFMSHQGWEVLGFTQFYFRARDDCRKQTQLWWCKDRIPEQERNGITDLEIGATDTANCFGWVLIRTRIEFRKTLYPTQGDIWPRGRFSVKTRIFFSPDSIEYHLIVWWRWCVCGQLYSPNLLGQTQLQIFYPCGSLGSLFKHIYGGTRHYWSKERWT